MATFIMLTRLSYEGLKSPASLADLSHEVMEHIRKNCPEVVWKSSYVVLGPTDYVDIFTAPKAPRVPSAQIIQACQIFSSRLASQCSLAEAWARLLMSLQAPPAARRAPSPQPAMARGGR